MAVMNFFSPKSLSIFFLILSSNFLGGCHLSINSGEEKTVALTPRWKKLGPGGGGSTFIPTFAYESSEKYLVRCDMTGSYLTSDGGKSYRQINFANGAASFAFDPSDSNTLYIGSAALNRSRDSGKTWKRIFPPEEEVRREVFQGDHADYRIEASKASLYNKITGSKRVRNVRVDPTYRQNIYFSMGSSFFYTENDGKSWVRIDMGYPVDFIYTNSGGLKEQVYVFSSHEIHIFNKKTKEIKGNPLPQKMIPAFSITGGTTADSDEVIFYALHNVPDIRADREFNYSEMWISTDHGQSWVIAGDRLLNNNRFGKKPSFSRLSSAEYDAGHAYVVSNRYEEKKEDGTSSHWYGALKTGDGGASWEWVWKGGGGSGQYGVKDGQVTANLKDAWVEKAFGGEYIRLIDVGVSPHDGKVAIVTDWYRTMKTVNGGKSWHEVYSKEQPEGGFTSRGMDVTTAYGVHVNPFDKNHLAISYTDIGYHHSFDGGRSWTRSVQGVPSTWRNTCYWLVFDPEVKGKVWSVWSNLHDFPRGKMTRNPRWKEYGKGGVCVSPDGGKTWQPSVEGMGFDSPSTSVVFDPNSEPGNRTLYVSTYNKGVFKSIDDGKTWTLKNNGIGENISAFELTIREDGTLFLIVSPTPAHADGLKSRTIHFGGVYRSVDGAETWEKLQVSEKALFPNGLDYDPNEPDRIYLACWADITSSDLVGSAVTSTTGGNEMLDFEGGIFMSEDGGDTWKQIFEEDMYVYDVTVDPYHEGRLYCNTFNKSAYRSDDYGESWKRLMDYDFHWGHRVIVDENDPEQVFLTTFGSSVWHGKAIKQ